MPTASQGALQTSIKMMAGPKSPPPRQWGLAGTLVPLRRTTWQECPVKTKSACSKATVHVSEDAEAVRGSVPKRPRPPGRRAPRLHSRLALPARCGNRGTRNGWALSATT